VRVIVLETDGVEVTKMLIENPDGLRTDDIRRVRFGEIFVAATASRDEYRRSVFEFEVPKRRVPGNHGGRARM